MDTLSRPLRSRADEATFPSNHNPRLFDSGSYSEAEKIERRALRLPLSEPAPAGILKQLPEGRVPVTKTPITAPSVLNEAPEYGSAFTRGLRVELPGGVTQLLISGTASVGENGETLYEGDFRAQLWRTYHNITRLLESENATWQDIVRTTCYIRDIERDYAAFNSVRNEFFHALGLDPFPASTAIQARICRSDLLVEIEAIAILVRGGGK
jgi:enamine deaminase RidA (YjgF/YER057c/UK114 family)